MNPMGFVQLGALLVIVVIAIFLTAYIQQQ
jgi:hypothetical protein